MAKQSKNLPTTADSTAVEHDPEARMMAERVLALKEETQWDLPVSRGKPLSGDALKNWLLKKEDQSAISRIERGIGYALLKRELGHGSYQGFLEDNNIPPASARSDRLVAHLYMGLSDANRERAHALPQRKLQVLATATPPMINDLFDSGALDEAADMSREQLRELVKLRKQIDKQAGREARLEQVIADQDQQLRARQALPETHAQVRELRQAVIEETQALRAIVAQLHAVMDRIEYLPNDVDAAQAGSITGPLMYALQGVRATAGALLQRGFNTFGQRHGYYADLDMLPPELAPEEIDQALRLAEQFRQSAELRTRFRQVEDTNNTPKRGRGRPRKGARA